jgi:hypothetical protein
MAHLIPLQKEHGLFSSHFQSSNNPLSLRRLSGANAENIIQAGTVYCTLNQHHYRHVISCPYICSMISRDELHPQIRNSDQKLPKIDEKGSSLAKRGVYLSRNGKFPTLDRLTIRHFPRTDDVHVTFRGLGIYFQTCGSDYLEILTASFRT